jgi:hypothetical protein
MDDFWDLTEELRAELDAERRAEALDVLRAGDAARRFVDELRALAPGEVVTLVVIDGASVRGRVLRVGADYVAIGEPRDLDGTARLRVHRRHDVRLDAISRLVREVDT